MKTKKLIVGSVVALMASSALFLPMAVYAEVLFNENVVPNFSGLNIMNGGTATINMDGKTGLVNGQNANFAYSLMSGIGFFKTQLTTDGPLTANSYQNKQATFSVDESGNLLTKSLFVGNTYSPSAKIDASGVGSFRSLLSGNGTFTGDVKVNNLTAENNILATGINANLITSPIVSTEKLSSFNIETDQLSVNKIANFADAIIKNSLTINNIIKAFDADINNANIQHADIKDGEITANNITTNGTFTSKGNANLGGQTSLQNVSINGASTFWGIANFTKAIIGSAEFGGQVIMSNSLNIAMDTVIGRSLKVANNKFFVDSDGGVTAAENKFKVDTNGGVFSNSIWASGSIWNGGNLGTNGDFYVGPAGGNATASINHTSGLIWTNDKVVANTGIITNGDLYVRGTATFDKKPNLKLVSSPALNCASNGGVVVLNANSQKICLSIDKQ